MVHVLPLLVIISASLSLFGCVVVLISAVIVKDHARFSRELLLNLHCMDGFAAVIFLVGASTKLHGHPCVGFGIALQFCYMASICWTSAIAYHLYRVVCQRRFGSVRIARSGMFYALCYGFPAITCIIAFPLNAFGHASKKEWCWLNSNGFQTAFAYTPMFAIWLYNGVMYSLLHSRIQHDFPFATRRAQTRLLLYLQVLLLCNFWGPFVRVLQLFDVNGDVVFAFNCLDASLSPLQGFLHAIAYNLHLRKAVIRGLCSGRFLVFGTKCDSGVTADLMTPLDSPLANPPPQTNTK